MNAVCVLAVNILGLSKAVNSTGAHERFRWRSSEWRLWGVSVGQFLASWKARMKVRCWPDSAPAASLRM